MDSLFDYLCGVATYWWALVPGILLSFFGLVAFVKGQDAKIPRPIVVGLFLGGLLLAQFLTYRDVYTENQNASAKLDTLKDKHERCVEQTDSLRHAELSCKQDLALVEQRAQREFPGASDGIQKLLEKFDELSKQLAPRTISAEQRERAAAILRRFSHVAMKVDVSPAPTLSKGDSQFASELEELFREAGWPVHDKTILVGGPPAFGIQIGFYEGLKDPQENPALVAIYNAIQALGEEPAAFGPNFRADAPDEVVITVFPRR